MTLPNEVWNLLLRLLVAIHRPLAILALALVGAFAGAAAMAQEPGWVTDSFSGCRSWDPYGGYFSETSYIWVGTCEGADNIAAGPGVVVMTDSYGVAVVPQKVTGKDNSDFLAYNENGSIAFESAHYGFPGPGHEGERMIVVSAADPSTCREFRYLDGNNHLVNTYDDGTLRADSLYATTTAIDEAVWTSLPPQRLIAAAENSLARGWTFGAALLYIKVIEFHPNGPEARAAQDGLARIKEKDPHVAVLARRLHMMVNSGTSL
jgi:hypothetical protein